MYYHKDDISTLKGVVLHGLVIIFSERELISFTMIWCREPLHREDWTQEG